MEMPEEYINNTQFDVSRTGVSRLSLTRFRSYEHLRLEVDLSPVVLTGDNGAGKTNILEALSFLIPGRGMRRAKLSDITTQKTVRDEINSFSGNLLPVSSTSSNWGVSATIYNKGEELTVGTGLETSFREEAGERKTSEKRVVKIEGEVVKNQAELGKIMTAVWLTPSMDRLFRGAPAPRRRFIDRLVYAFDPEHAKRTSAYEYALRQWNKLVKEGRKDDFWFRAIEETMASNAVAVAAARCDVAKKLSHILNESIGEFPRGSLSINGKVENWLEEMSAIDVEDKLKELYIKERQNAFFEGNISVEGPHKTDIDVVHKEKNMPARLCSTGEQKALLIAIILAQATLQTRTYGKAPILLLDEVTAHLDENRREALFNEICELNAQAWLTGTDEKVFRGLRNKAQLLKVENSQIVSSN
jgi:DNA replication and repair protein RecF